MIGTKRVNVRRQCKTSEEKKTKTQLTEVTRRRNERSIRNTCLPLKKVCTLAKKGFCYEQGEHEIRKYVKKRR